jgi:pimeloyl-ACP methyl ester carboxylesterase
MDSHTAPIPSSQPGTLHFIPPNLSAFEPAKALANNPNTLLWIGGLFDTPLSVTYPLRIAQALPPTWALMTASLGSSGYSWGTSTIAQDADDMAKIICFIRDRRPNGRIVIMGHSTGCQDCMEYTTGKNAASRPAVQGVILQAPVSDREAVESYLPKAFMIETNQLALQMCRDGKDKDAMPYRLTKQIFGRVAITARRWADIASPAPNHDGADDFFSSDLPDERLATSFGKLPAASPLLILEGGKDESVPQSVDKQALVDRWVEAVKRGEGKVDETHGGIVEGASHNLNDDPEAVVQDLVRRVLGFVSWVERDDFVHRHL